MIEVMDRCQHHYIHRAMPHERKHWVEKEEFAPKTMHIGLRLLEMICLSVSLHFHQFVLYKWANKRYIMSEVGKLSVEGQMVNNLGFTGYYVIFVSTIQLCQ